mgnify:CR=1 FL=1
MTLLLASVTGPDEAALMLAHGADIIDLKDPSNGALGALAPDVVRATVAAIQAGGRERGDRQSADGTGGDRRSGRDHGADRGRLRQGRTVPGPRAAGVRAGAGVPARTTEIIGVMFADCGADNDLVKMMAGCGFAGAMLDTSDKRAGGLLDCMDVASLREFVGACRELRHDDRPCRIAGGARCPTAPLAGARLPRIPRGALRGT